MIDFRYHLVSLVAVFIALAVGIALGAGPLREGISSTLEGEVNDLRSERAELRSQVDSATSRAAAKDEALGLSAERIAAATLTDVRVALVLLPGADRNTLDTLENSLEGAGARLGVTIDLSNRWEDPDRVAEQTELVQELGTTLMQPAPRRGETPTLSTLLAATLAAQDQPGSFGSWVTVAGQLDDAGVLDLNWHDRTVDDMLDRRPADVVVVLSGGLDPDQVEEDPGLFRLEQRLDLVEALSRTGLPVVVSGEGGDAAPVEGVLPVDPLITHIRADRDLAAEVSTVDNLESSGGRLATTLATAWEAIGESGHYGTAADAQAPVPAPPPVQVAEIPDTTPSEPVPDPSEDLEGDGLEDSTGEGVDGLDGLDGSVDGSEELDDLDDQAGSQGGGQDDALVTSAP